MIKALLIGLSLYLGCLSQQAFGKSAPKVVTVVFHDVVSEDSIDKLEEAFKAAAASRAKSILLVIDSPGGSLSAAQRAIRDIDTSDIPVDCIADGEAASAAFYMLQSCRTRGITSKSTLLFHEAHIAELGLQHVRERDLRDLLHAMETANKAMIEYCSARMGLNPQAVRDQLAAGDWWMTAPEGLQAGAVDYLSKDLKSVQQSIEKTGKPTACLGQKKPDCH